ncbi:MAG TPA: SDR family NAD(P)-dependent oxidoreductase, partial [Bacteroidales bacterium]|nr:SDR family NAD(P)-dependent oxidoreductase [Bacteroidales bacterium]
MDNLNLQKTVFITGATSGIGEQTAIEFAKHGDKVIITGRRRERLEILKAKIQEDFKGEVLAIHMDVRNYNEVKDVISKLPEDFKVIDILINNAGLALGFVPFQEGLVEDWDIMIDTNFKGLLYVTSCIVPIMIEAGKGHIINIGSIAGREVLPNGNVYCATKHAVDGFTKGLRHDLIKYGIKVTQVAPGATETEFSIVRFKGDKERADNVYKGFKPLIAEDIANIIYYISTLPPHVNIADILIYNVSNIF